MAKVSAVATTGDERPATMPRVRSPSTAEVRRSGTASQPPPFEPEAQRQGQLDCWERYSTPRVPLNMQGAAGRAAAGPGIGIRRGGTWTPPGLGWGRPGGYAALSNLHGARWENARWFMRCRKLSLTKQIVPARIHSTRRPGCGTRNVEDKVCGHSLVVSCHDCTPRDM